jgi:hypothetical protein
MNPATPFNRRRFIARTTALAATVGVLADRVFLR